jgi:adenylate cyclase
MGGDQPIDPRIVKAGLSMAVQTPAIVGAYAINTAISPRLRAWVRGIGVRQARIACGLVMFSYIFSHFSNHALGNISYDAMEAWLQYHIWWWRSWPGTVILYSAALVHFSLGLWALYERRHFRYVTIEIAQLLLGLSVPLLLIVHFAGVRLNGALFGRQILYGQAIYTYWVVRPYMEWVQFVLLTVAWTHACIGLYFWLRLKPFFKWAAPFLLAVAGLLPVLALLGLIHGGRQVVHLSSTPEWRAANIKPVPPDQRAVLDGIIFYFPFGYGALIGLVFVARGVRTWREQRRGMLTVSYPDRQVRVPKGLTILETSLRFKVAHASVCGGRARCSTCRIRVISDLKVLPRPSRRESFVLARIGASSDPAIRLACQLRPRTDIAVIPLLPPHVGADFVRNRTRTNFGRERYVVSMFIDMRGSTKLAEMRLPFDVVFLINRFLGAASQAVIEAGGQPNQFIGDGLLALFGLDVDSAKACRQAMRAAALVGTNVEYMNHQFAADLREPIQFGIGIHGGKVVIGDIGFRDHTVFTAVGDAVNVAARLQDTTKILGCPVIISEEVCRAAGINVDALARTEVSIRGRNESMVVRIVPDPTVLQSLLDLNHEPDTAKPKVPVARASA